MRYIQVNVWAFNDEWNFFHSLFLSKIEMRIVSSVSMDIREYDTNKLGHKGQNGKFMWCMWSWVLIFVDIVCTQIEKWKTCVRTPSCHRRVCFGMIMIVFPIWDSKPIIPYFPYTVYRRRRGISFESCAPLANKTSAILNPLFWFWRDAYALTMRVFSSWIDLLWSSRLD